VSIRVKSRNIPTVADAVKSAARRERLPFVEADDQNLVGKLIAEPQLSDLPVPIQENLIVELYSKV
jgi:ribosomal protein S4